jgi:hypothetical protein
MTWLDISMVAFVLTVFIAGIALLVKVAIIDEKKN